MKLSKPERVGTCWRVRRHDGELVGWYMTRDLAQKSIDKSPWLR